MIDRANEAASILALAIGETENSFHTLDKNPQIVGVVNTEGSEAYMNIVSHPLWSYRPGEGTLISKSIDELLEVADCDHVRLIDTFNIERRVSWVIGEIKNPDIFRTHDVAANGTGSAMENSFFDIWVKTRVGDTFDWSGDSWMKVTPESLWSVEDGRYLVIDRDVVHGVVPEPVRLRRMHGKLAAQRKPSGKYEPSKNPDLKIIATLVADS